MSSNLHAKLHKERMRLAGRCEVCGKPRVTSAYCYECHQKVLNRRRARYGWRPGRPLKYENPDRLKLIGKIING